MLLISAPNQGTGKTLISQTLGGIVMNKVKITPAPTGYEAEAEWQKKLLSILMNPDPITVFDNLPDGKTFDSATLAGVLTTGEFAGRILGKSEYKSFPVKTVIVATGNNVRIGIDMQRRYILSKIDANMEKPWQRKISNFNIPDIENHVRDNRAQYIADCLTLIRAWFAAGKPKNPDHVETGSYEAWARTIGGIFAYAGIPGFMANYNDAISELNSEGAENAAFFEKWREKCGIDYLRLDLIIADLNNNQDFQDALPSCLVFSFDKGGRAQKAAFGSYLNKLNGRVYGGYKLQSRTNPHCKTKEWGWETI